MPFVYMLRCRDGSLYTGAAKDLERRLSQHRKGSASRYTRSRLPVRLAWSCRVSTWPRALRMERLLKCLDREQKLALVRGHVVCRLRTGSASQSALRLIPRRVANGRSSIHKMD